MPADNIDEALAGYFAGTVLEMAESFEKLDAPGTADEKVTTRTGTKDRKIENKAMKVTQGENKRVKVTQGENKRVKVIQGENNTIKVTEGENKTVKVTQSENKMLKVTK